MYRKILIPTDGSEHATAAVKVGIEFAQQCDAEVIGVYVASEYQYPVSMDIIPPTYPSEDEYLTSTRKIGENYLAAIRTAAEAAGLKYRGVVAWSDRTAQAIVETAEQHHCDLIFIGSHGRSGWEQLLLGSVTTKLLSICKMPILVYRLEKHSRS